MLVYLALGSNLGERELHLKSAISGLCSHDVKIIRCASIYSTEPKEVLSQPWFLNTAVEGNTSLDPAALLRACIAVEETNSRKRTISKGPRTLDIDIIFYGNEIVRKPGLVIPHPHFFKRRFVLEPLAEIAADFVDPRSHKTVRQLLEDTPDVAQVHRIGAPLLL